MNSFYEHHKRSIRWHYRCFNRILLNGLIQPFQQPERVVGFFNTYRQLYPVSRTTLRGIAEQFQAWLKTWAGKRSIPVIEAPQGRRDDFVDPYFSLRFVRPGRQHGERLFYCRATTGTCLKRARTDSGTGVKFSSARLPEPGFAITSPPAPATMSPLRKVGSCSTGTCASPAESLPLQVQPATISVRYLNAFGSSEYGLPVDVAA